MPTKVERFTQRARRVLSLAQEDAERLQHPQIGTEHMLLGLIREEGGVAGRVLRNLGLQQARVEELLVRLNIGKMLTEGRSVELAPATKRTLELAVDEARRMGHHYIGTEHLLLGLVRQPDSACVEILNTLGISPEVVRRQTRRALQEVPPPAGGTSASTLSDSPQRVPSTTPTQLLLLRNVERRADVCGGEACLMRTRIPIWLLVQAHRLGATEPELLNSYPSLHAVDLVTAWEYYDLYPAEIDAAIARYEQGEA